MHAATVARLGAGINREDKKSLFSAIVVRHKHVRPCLCFNSSKLTASVSCDPAFAIVGDMHLGAVISLTNVRDGNLSTPLLQKPINELFATPSLLQETSHEADMAHVLQYATRSLRKFLPGGPLFPKCIT